MAREIRSIAMLREMELWTIVSSLAHRASRGESVGPKVELWVKEMKR